MAIYLQAGRSRFDFHHGKIFLFYTASTPGSGTYPAFYSMGTGEGAISSGVKRSGLEADHLPPSSAEVKNDGAVPPLSHMSSRSA
jgi:hypothetical protein